MGCTVNAAWPYFLLPGAERAVTLSASLIDCLPLCVWFTGKHSFVLLMGGWNHKEAYSKDKHMACTTSWLSLNYLCNIWKICIHDFCGIFTLLFYYLFIYLLNWFIQGNKKKKEIQISMIWMKVKPSGPKYGKIFFAVCKIPTLKIVSILRMLLMPPN